MSQATLVPSPEIRPPAAPIPAPPGSGTGTGAGSGSGSGAGVVRATSEFLIVLCLSVLLFRTFAAEAYIVPTGSMAPTLLGQHVAQVCPNCDFRVVVGVDESGRGGRPVCPNCGQTDLDREPLVASHGDRVLVQKFLYDLRRPRRWEVGVFHFPGDPSQAYVKRVVGLPGELVRIVRGDVWVNGQIARKTLAEQRATRLLVYDHDFPPRDATRVPRWRFRRGRGAGSSWSIEGTRLVHRPTESRSGEPIDWAEYCHWDPDRARYAPVHDFNAYNGTDVPGENVVGDLMLSALVWPSYRSEAIFVRLDSGADRFLVEIPVRGRTGPRAWRNGIELPLKNPRVGGIPVRESAPAVLLEASVFDQRLLVAADGAPLFDPFDYESATVGPASGYCPVALGVKGQDLTVSEIRVYRDIYYTSVLAFTPRTPFGVDEPYPLGPDEYFVLGDNSAVSNDSRFWNDSPVVPGEMFLGKPFLVHLPGQAMPLRVFGRSLYWVPDPRQIRYIR